MSPSHTFIVGSLNSFVSLLLVEVAPLLSLLEEAVPPGVGRVLVLETVGLSSSMEGDLRGLSAGRGGGESSTLLDTVQHRNKALIYYLRTNWLI